MMLPKRVTGIQQANQIFFASFKGGAHNPLCPKLLPNGFFCLLSLRRKNAMHIFIDKVFFRTPISLQKSMRKPNRSPRQPNSTAKPSKKRTGKQPIRKLAISDDLGVLFSHGQENDTPHSFASALATGIPATTLAEILTEKEELPTTAQSLQAAIKNSPPPQDRIDLHGCTASEAETKTENFLARARRNHLKTVMVITGKGLHSPEGSVLKDIIETRLKIMKNDGLILAYLWEKKSLEKSGALLVYLP